MEASLGASNLVFVAVSNTFFPHMSDRPPTKSKKPYPLTYFLVLGSRTNEARAKLIREKITEKVVKS